ncbi:MAG: signal transduction histidine kinase [Cellvibrionaceae bacterium]|jgi:signal transduction histidine kinase
MTYINAENLPAETLIRIIEVSQQLNTTTDVDVLLNQIIQTAADLIGSEASSLLLFDPQMGDLRFRAAVGDRSAELKNMSVPLQGSIAGTIYLKNEPMIVDNVANSADWQPSYDEEVEFQTQTLLGVPLHDGSGKVVGVLEAINRKSGTFNDTDKAVLSIFADLAGVAINRAQLFEELQQAYYRVNELDRLKSDFIALASHELRTPLSVILGYMSFLRSDVRGVQADQVDHIMRAAIRLRNLIQDMLNLQYVDNSDKIEGREIINVTRMIREVSTERKEMALARKLIFRLHLPKEKLFTFAEPNMMSIIFNNLIDNAFKFTTSGGRIDVGVASRNGEIWIYVRDTGIGIPEDQLNRIFDRFYQVEHHIDRRFEGMGIGLSIVKELIELHEGRVWAKSSEGKGSEFFVVLKKAESE